MNEGNSKRVQRLIEKGAKIPVPESVFIGDEVCLDRISANGVVIYPGCRILGSKTVVMAGAKLGLEGPATVDDCQIGPEVELAGGFFRQSVFFKKAKMGSGAQVRGGCILEEQASGAHCVGIKQTILFPFVTLGSLINFCDCLMAGGTSRKNHSEVGSSYIHFNFTTNQDKATASLIGDVPRGVMLNQAPIFLGGQGGLVGPLRIEFGTAIAAGIICRKDLLDGNKLVVDQKTDSAQAEQANTKTSTIPGIYWKAQRRVANNFYYIANLIALRHWYVQVRSMFFRDDLMEEMLYQGALEKLDLAIAERLKQLGALAKKMGASAQIYAQFMKSRADQLLLTQKKQLHDRWPRIMELFESGPNLAMDPSTYGPFVDELELNINRLGRDYVTVIQALSPQGSKQASAWLQSIVDTLIGMVLEEAPAFKP